MDRFCSQCGAILMANTRFCGSCGAMMPILSSAEAAPTPLATTQAIQHANGGALGGLLRCLKVIGYVLGLYLLGTLVALVVGSTVIYITWTWAQYHHQRPLSLTVISHFTNWPTVVITMIACEYVRRRRSRAKST